MKSNRVTVACRLSLSFFALVLFFASCNLGLETAPVARKGAITVSLSGTGNASGAANDTANARALSANAGFLYLQTGLTADTAKFYGPYPASSGAAVTITDIEAGSYAAISLLFVSELPSLTLSPIIPATATAEGMRVATQTALSGFPDVRDAASVAFIPDYTVLWGRDNSIRASLVPLTALEPNGDGDLDIAGSVAGVTRRFVRVSGLQARFPVAGSGTVRALKMTVSNSSASTVSVTGVGLYDARGGRLVRENPATTLDAGSAFTRSVEWTGEDEYYAYVEFYGLSVTCSFLPTTNALRTVTFDANGGTGTIAPQSDLEGTAITLPSSGFTREGYTFLGWSVSPTATIPGYSAGSSYTLGGTDVTLYAVWADSFTVRTITYNGNGGSGSVAAQSGPEGAQIPLAANGFTRTGYTFQGWSTLATATTPEYPVGYSFTLGTGNVTLYAIWADVTAPVIVSLSMNDGAAGSNLSTGNYLKLECVEAGVGLQSLRIDGDFSVSGLTAWYEDTELPASIIDNRLVFTTPHVVNGTLTIAGIALSGEGVKAVTVTPEDANGNIGPATNASITFDTTIPTLPMFNLFDSLGHSYTATGDIVVKGTIGDGGSGVSRFNLTGSVASLDSASVLINGSAVGFTYSNSAKTVTLATPVTGSGVPFEIRNVTLPSPSNTYSIGLTVSDGAGNVSLSAGGSIMSDRTAPIVEELFVYDTSSDNSVYTNGDFRLECSISEDCSQYTTITVTSSGGTVSIADAIVNIAGSDYPCTRAGNTLTLSSSPYGDYSAMIIRGLQLTGVSDGESVTISLTLANACGLTATATGTITVDLVAPTIASVTSGTSSSFTIAATVDTGGSGVQVIMADQQNTYSATRRTSDFNGLSYSSSWTVPPAGGLVSMGVVLPNTGSTSYYHYLRIDVSDVVGNSRTYFIERTYNGTNGQFPVSFVGP